MEIAWDEAALGSGVIVDSEGLVASRPADGGGGVQAGARAIAGRGRGRRYFEIEISSNSCFVGISDSEASLEDALGQGGAGLQWGYSTANSVLYYRDDSGAGSIDTEAPVLAGGVYGFLVDFNLHMLAIYRNGELIVSDVAVSFPLSTTLFPAASMETGAVSVELNILEPFQYPPLESFTPWVVSDIAVVTKVSGSIQVNDSPAARMVKAFTFDRINFLINGSEITESKPLGQTISDNGTGDYEIILRDSYSREVFVVAFDDYGERFSKNAAVDLGNVVHPSTPNGYVYRCTGSGSLPSAEPNPWPINTESDQLIGTASFSVAPFLRPLVHGPVTPDVDVLPGEVYTSNWRVKVTANNGGANTGLGFIKFITHDGKGSHNLVVDILSGDSTGTAEGAFIGDLGDSSRWSTSEAAPWIGCEFDGNRKVVAVELYPPSNATYLSEMPVTFSLEYSFNGYDYIELDTFTAPLAWSPGEPQKFVVVGQQVSSDLDYHDLILSYSPTAFYDISGGYAGVNLGTVSGLNLNGQTITTRYGIDGISRPTNSAGAVHTSALFPRDEYSVIFLFATTRTSFTAIAGFGGGASNNRVARLYTQYSSGNDIIIAHQTGSGSYYNSETFVDKADGQWHVHGFARKNAILETYGEESKIGTRLNCPVGEPPVQVTKNITFLKEGDGGYPSPNETSWVGLKAFIPKYLTEDEFAMVARKIREEYGLS